LSPLPFTSAWLSHTIGPFSPGEVAPAPGANAKPAHIPDAMSIATVGRPHCLRIPPPSESTSYRASITAAPLSAQLLAR
jgi:hypothetical protein